MDLDYINLPNGLKYFPQTDVNGRNKGKIIVDENGNNKYGEYLTYLKVGDHGTNIVSSMRYGGVKAGNYVINDSLKYRYDANGNISEILENGLIAVKYTYDALNRLIREDNRQFCKTVLWTYDNFGNILYKRTTAYTVKVIEEIKTFTEEKEYLYDGKYPDMLNFPRKMCLRRMGKPQYI